MQKEDIAVGLENAPRTFMRLFSGGDFGKQLLKMPMLRPNPAFHAGGRKLALGYAEKASANSNLN